MKKDNKYTLGLDIGSTTSKAIILDKKKNIVFFKIIDSGSDLEKSAIKLYKICLSLLGTGTNGACPLLTVISTGYGRYKVPFATKQITEITAHGIGTKYLFPKTKTIIDLGGQDSKIIKLNKDGQTIDFIMNDKCAAGCGRFLETMAKKLKTPLSSFEKLAKNSKKNLNINSTCTVFAESEIISHLAKGEKKDNIIKGIHTNLISKIINMGNYIGFEEEVILTGGVAKNIHLKHLLQKTLKKKVKSPKEPQITAALGAALYKFKS